MGNTTMNRYVLEKWRRKSKVVHTLWREAELKMWQWRTRWYGWPILPLEAISASIGLVKGSLMMSIAHVTIKGQMDACGLDCHHVDVQGPCCCRSHSELSGLCNHLRPWWCLNMSCSWEPCLSQWPHHTRGLCWCTEIYITTGPIGSAGPVSLGAAELVPPIASCLSRKVELPPGRTGPSSIHSGMLTMTFHPFQHPGRTACPCWLQQ